MIPTFLALAFPGLRLDPMHAYRFSFEEWRTCEYNWDQDDFGGLLDLTQSVPKTIELGNGDCEDFAFVAASWGISHNKETSIGIVGVKKFGIPLVQHVVAVVDGYIYSSGEKIEATLDEYVEQHDTYTWGIERSIPKHL